MKQLKSSFSRNDSGFTLIELLIYLVIVGILMAMVLSSFTQTIQRTGQQSGIAETKIETGIGLDLLRVDLEHAGFGLPWEFQTNPTYTEPGPMNDASNVPKAIISQDASATGINNGADRLVIRSTNAIVGITGQKWGYVGRLADHTVDIQSMSTDTFVNTEGVIVIQPEISPGQYRRLVMNGTTYITKPTVADLANFAPPATPNDPNGVRYLVYGLNLNDTISRPFNRTDYFILTTNVPSHCAPGTGVLEKATLNQVGTGFTSFPIVDCVADFQIVYHLDTDEDGGSDTEVDADGLDGLTAEQIRDRVKEIRCYILTHEGGLDRSYTYPNDTINVGEIDTDGTTLLFGRNFDLSEDIAGNWANYRWKVVSMTVAPKNLK